MSQPTAKEATKMKTYPTTPIPGDLAPNDDHRSTGHRHEPATEKQVNFLRSLAVERDIAEEHRTELLRRLDAGEVSKARASEWIERLLDKPKVAKRTLAYDNTTLPEVPSPDALPAGHYAVENNDGELRFYHVWRGTRRPDYFKLYVEHGPDDSEVPFKAALTILGKIIEAGPRDCAIRYGREIGACSICSRRLTNRLSRELGIGPVCGGRFEGEDWTEIKATARETIRARGEDPSDNIED